LCYRWFWIVVTKRWYCYLWVLEQCELNWAIFSHVPPLGATCHMVRKSAACAGIEPETLRILYRGSTDWAIWPLHIFSPDKWTVLNRDTFIERHLSLLILFIIFSEKLRKNGDCVHWMPPFLVDLVYHILTIISEKKILQS
jgi:hypothetical protein